MKILCVSDQIDPLIYSVNAKERYHDVSLVLAAGDLPMEYLGFIASTLNRPLLFVFGNHNLKRMYLFKKVRGSDPGFVPPLGIHEHFFGSTYVGGKVVLEKGLLIAGLGGSKLYNGGENQFSERQMHWKMIKLVPRLWWNKIRHGRYLDILLTHASPLGIHDREDPCHVGFRCFLWFMERFKPRYLLHGHIHLYDTNATRLTMYQETAVINVFSHYILNLQSAPNSKRHEAHHD